MAKVTIHLEDIEGDLVDVTADFDPPCATRGELTIAQHSAAMMLDFMSKHIVSGTKIEIS